MTLGIMMPQYASAPRKCEPRAQGVQGAPRASNRSAATVIQGGVNPLFKLFVKLHVWLYGVSRRFGATMAGMQVILLTTTGKKISKARTVPVVSHFDGDQLYVIASMGGAPQNPAWYGNLTAQLEVTVQVKGDRFVAKAQTVAEGAERDRLWKDIKTQMPQFAGYEAKTSRVIPVVKLERAASA